MNLGTEGMCVEFHDGCGELEQLALETGWGAVGHAAGFTGGCRSNERGAELSGCSPSVNDSCHLAVGQPACCVPACGAAVMCGFDIATEKLQDFSVSQITRCRGRVFVS